MLNTLPYHEACRRLAMSGHVTALTDETKNPACIAFKTHERKHTTYSSIPTITSKQPLNQRDHSIY